MKGKAKLKGLGFTLALLAIILFSIPAFASEEAMPWFKSLEIGLTGTGIVQGVTQKRDVTGKKYDRSYATYSIDLEANSKISETGHAYMLVEAGNGLGADQYYNVFGTLNEDAIGSQPLEVSELWYQQDILNGMFKFKIGKVDLTDNFDTNNVADDEETQFLAGIFVNNPTIEFPDYCFAATLWAEPTKLVSVGLAYGNADASWNEVFKYPFLMAEVDIHPEIFGLAGNYRFMVWRNANWYNENWAGVHDQVNFGTAISFDQKVLPELTLFTRWGWANPDIADNKIENAVSLGFQLDGAYWGRDKDHVAFAYGWNILNGNYRDEVREAGFSPRDEQHFEVYYHFAVNDNVNICPDVQFVMNPQGVKENHNMLVVGVRGQVEF